METIKKIDRILKSSNYKPIFLILNDIDNDYVLSSVLDDMKENDKEELEEGIIGLTLREEISKEEKSFLNKYKRFVMNKANKNNMEYLNNNYLSFLYHKEFEKIAKDKNYDSQINQKSIWDIYQELCDKFNEISDKLKNNTNLTSEEHKFFKKYILSTVFYDTINKKYEGENDIMYDVVEYFDKYPITKFDNIENRQLYILYNLSKQLLKIDVDSVVTFDRYHNEKDIESEGFFTKLNDGRYRINISNLDDLYLKDEKTMFESLFTVFHELGHLMQEINNDSYPKEIQELFKWERYIINKDNDFYNRYHDSFYLEKDADMFALNRILDLFKNEKPENIVNLINKYEKKKRIDFPKFYNMVFQRYNQLLANQENNSVKHHH